MKTIYAIDYLDKFFTVEIPVMSENDTMYFLDYDRLTYEQKYATDWNIALDKDKEGTYYIGFDCGHICDGNDYNLALKYGLIDEKRFNELLEMQIHLPTFLEPVRSLEYVEEQCKKIVDQLEVGK